MLVVNPIRRTEPDFLRGSDPIRFDDPIGSAQKLYAKLFVQKTIRFAQNYAHTVLQNKTDRNYLQQYAKNVLNSICIQLMSITAEFDTVGFHFCNIILFI